MSKRVRRCIRCRCTDKRGCPSPRCYWVAANLCSNCLFLPLVTVKKTHADGSWTFEVHNPEPIIIRTVRLRSPRPAAARRRRSPG